MTIAALFAGLLPIMLGSGTGSEVMRRIAAPMVGGMASVTLLTLVVIPATWLLWQRRNLGQKSAGSGRNGMAGHS
jgi:Cu(I)/Ag(I) efflux system membrane protein CusA/SilA